MAEELRNVYNRTFTDKLTSTIEKEYPIFDREKCNRLIYQEDWQTLALKERMRRITVSLHETLPKEYKEALDILYKVAPQFSGSLSGIIFPDYVDQYGLEDWEESMKALAFFTQYSTSEFAVRPFLLKNKDKMLEIMFEWSNHQNEHVRRLACEGSRPRLPWGLSVPALKESPEQTLLILTNLKEDNSLYVRKSVANHLNDISYYNPELVLDLAHEWYGKHKHTDWIIKHACRSLLKKGNQRALSLFGYKDDNEIEVKDFVIEKEQISIGDSLPFSFTITSKKEMPVRVEYAIDYVKSKGHRTKKVFMISTINMKTNETRTITKQQSFKELTTRKHYSGTHTISIIINGIIKATLDFEVVESKLVTGTQ
jgi:3-methyladenine DNA glycosylase AlkC